MLYIVLLLYLKYKNSHIYSRYMLYMKKIKHLSQRGHDPIPPKYATAYIHTNEQTIYNITLPIKYDLLYQILDIDLMLLNTTVNLWDAPHFETAPTLTSVDVAVNEQVRLHLVLRDNPLVVHKPLPLPRHGIKHRCSLHSCLRSPYREQSHPGREDELQIITTSTLLNAAIFSGST